jgi:Cu(I)-responsive transcriptional regulator
MKIGQAADITKLPSKTIRYYEEVDLVVPGRRTNGYRDYSDFDIRCLSFVQRARRLGFTVEECRSLLALYKDEHRTSSDVKALAKEKLNDVRQKIEELTDMANKLSDLLDDCPGNAETTCPILDGLSADRDYFTNLSTEAPPPQECH